MHGEAWLTLPKQMNFPKSVSLELNMKNGVVNVSKDGGEVIGTRLCLSDAIELLFLYVFIFV